MNLTNSQKAGLFKMLASKPLYEVGIEYGFDKKYSTPKSVKSAVYNIYKAILNEPEKYLVQPETIELVQNAVSARKITTVKGKPLAEKMDTNLPIEDLIKSNRAKAANLISRKLDEIGRTKKGLASISLPQLATSFGILFDKAQIIQGQATEHVALMGKIDSALSAEDKLDMVLKMREVTVAQKGK